MTTYHVQNRNRLPRIIDVREVAEVCTRREPGEATVVLNEVNATP
jgi:hypothetical protein